MIGVAIITIVAFLAVLEHHFGYIDSGLVGLSLSYALSVTGLLQGMMRTSLLWIYRRGKKII